VAASPIDYSNPIAFLRDIFKARMQDKQHLIVDEEAAAAGEAEKPSSSG